MNKLILAAAASGFVFAAPLMAQHMDHAAPLMAQHMDHAAHAAQGDAHVKDTATFMKEHGEQVSAAINHPTRKEDKLRDQYRHPAETLAFFHVGPHMKVGEYAPGGGWYSRLLGHYLGGEGQLVGLYANPLTATPDPARQQRIRDTAAGFGKEVAGYTGLPADKFSGITLDNLEGQKGTFDRILVMRAMHNLLRSGTADTELRAMRELLKDDGLLGIEQHRAHADALAGYARLLAAHGDDDAASPWLLLRALHTDFVLVLARVNSTLAAKAAASKRGGGGGGLGGAAAGGASGGGHGSWRK